MALWRFRSPRYSRRTWLVMLLLDVLPWPWGEEILARLFIARAFVRWSQLRKALIWARYQPPSSQGRWRLALSVCANHGRFLARQALVGIRTPDDLRKHIVLEGEEHLKALSGGAILLGFHMGATPVPIALRAAGYRVTWVGGVRGSRRWASEPWRLLREPVDDLSVWQRSWALGGVLYRARRLLLDGGILCMTADGDGGRVLFPVALPGSTVRIRAGWFALRRLSGAPVLPLLSHLDGATQVITIYPPLPVSDPDSDRDLAACRDTITTLLEHYAQEFPEQTWPLHHPSRHAISGTA